MKFARRLIFNLMPILALATDALVEDFNNLRSQGRLLTNELQIARLKQRIEVTKSENWIEYWLYSGSLFCLMGDVEKTIHAGRTALNLTSDYRYHLYHMRTLMHLGKFGLARDVISNVPDHYFLEPDDDECYCLLQTMEFSRFLRIARERPEDEPMIYLSEAVCRILEHQKVEEDDVRSMVDLAGELLRDKGFISSSDIEILPYPSDETIAVNLPVAADPTDVADLDWEYAERLFTTLPNAPATVVHVGFSCAREIENA
jgi:hypothetical protein